MPMVLNNFVLLIVIIYFVLAVYEASTILPDWITDDCPPTPEYDEAADWVLFGNFSKYISSLVAPSTCDPPSGVWLAY